jgi:hypothetical protein
MSKKQEKKKNLRKSLCAIVDIYMEQKGKEKRKQLKSFIDQKIAEIISFSDNLSNKKKNSPKKEKSENDTEIKPQVSVLGPSPALADKLHNSTNNDQKFKNVAAT